MRAAGARRSLSQLSPGARKHHPITQTLPPTRSAIKMYAVISRIISHDLPQSRAISRNVPKKTRWVIIIGLLRRDSPPFALSCSIFKANPGARPRPRAFRTASRPPGGRTQASRPQQQLPQQCIATLPAPAISAPALHHLHLRARDADGPRPCPGLRGGTAAPGRQHAHCRQPPERADL